MKSAFLALTASGALAAGGCATAAASPSSTDHAHHDAAHDAHHAAPAADVGPPARIVDLTPPTGTTPKEMKLLVDTPALKLASLTLRGGTILPDHDGDVPVMIVAQRGKGVVVANGERLPIDVDHAVFLAPKVRHAVEPEPGTDLVLLVYHLGQGQERHQ